MSFDLTILGNKLKRYREQFQLSQDEVSVGTGISRERLQGFETGSIEPTGDDILILADFYKCDYKFFVSNDNLAPFEQTETLFRRFGQEFSKEDRWKVQEFLFLSECEAFLEEELHKRPALSFTYEKKGQFFKAHGEDAAAQLRKFFGYAEREVRLNVYLDFRKLGIHIFRRKLSNSNVSGLYLKHPSAGDCVLINYDEDIYRQRFTAAHEAGHAILDNEKDFVVSFRSTNADLVETRANVFASRYLMPPEFLRTISTGVHWDKTSVTSWASKLKVSTEALTYALLQTKLINKETAAELKRAKVPSSEKVDPELPNDLSPKIKERKKEMLARGLSNYYVELCFEGFREGIISRARLAEMLLAESDPQLRELADLYREPLAYGG